MQPVVAVSAVFSVVAALAQPQEPPPKTIHLPGFACTHPKYGIRLPRNLSALRKLSVPVQEQDQEVREWDGYKTTDKVIRFDGLTLQVITFSNDPERYMLSLAVVESAVWNLTPVRVGQPVVEALARLGQPARAQSGPLRLSGESESIYVGAKNGRVSLVVYECYTG